MSSVSKNPTIYTSIYFSTHFPGLLAVSSWDMMWSWSHLKSGPWRSCCYTWGAVEAGGLVTGGRHVPPALSARGGVLGNLLHLSIVIFISFILACPPTPPALILFFYLIVFSFLPCLFRLVSHSLTCTPDCQLCCSPLPARFVVALPPPPLCPPTVLQVWGHLTRSICSPSFRTLSPCHFLFPVRQLPFFLFLCY